MPLKRDLGRRLRSLDLSAHPLGPLAHWPVGLVTTLRLMLAAREPAAVFWGEERFCFLNDACLPLLGVAGQYVPGARAAEVWGEQWNTLAAHIAVATPRGGRVAAGIEPVRWMLEHADGREETFQAITCSPLPDDSGGTGGVWCVFRDETDRIRATGRLALLRDIAAAATHARSRRAFFRAVQACLVRAPGGIPFALVYVFDARRTRAERACAQGMTPDDPAAPAFIELDAADPAWPATDVAGGSGAQLVENLPARFGFAAGAETSIPARDALVMPLVPIGTELPVGFLVAGMNAPRTRDPGAREFVELLATQLGAGVARFATGVAGSRGAARASRESEIRLRHEAEAARQDLAQVLAGTSDLAGVFDREWRCLHVDPRVLSLGGRAGEDVHGRVCWEAFPRAVGTALEREMRAAMAGRQPRQFEYFHEPFQRWFECRATPFSEGLRLFATDITERKAAEAKARASEAWIAQLVSLMPAAVYTCDTEGRITYFNRQAAELWGTEPKLGDEDRRFCGSLRLWRTDGTHLRHEETPMAVAIREGRSTRNEEVIIERPDGARIAVSVNIDPLLDAAGRRTGAINVFTDITERRRVELAWRESEARLRLATETGKIGLWEWDIVHDRITWTRSLYAIHGVDPATFDATVSGFSALIHPDDHARVTEAIRRALEEGSPYELEFRIRRPDGGVTWVFTYATVVREHGRATRMLGAEPGCHRAPARGGGPRGERAALRALHATSARTRLDQGRRRALRLRQRRGGDRLWPASAATARARGCRHLSGDRRGAVPAQRPAGARAGGRYADRRDAAARRWPRAPFDRQQVRDSGRRGRGAVCRRHGDRHHQPV